MDVTGMTSPEVILRQEAERVRAHGEAARRREGMERQQAEASEAAHAELLRAADAVHDAAASRG